MGMDLGVQSPRCSLDHGAIRLDKSLLAVSQMPVGGDQSRCVASWSEGQRAAKSGYSSILLHEVR